MMGDFKSSLRENPETDFYDVARFDKSLRELRDLCSQLHYAADYCEKAYLKANKKKTVMENTKEYICRAVVTVVDHLGNVSANLESRISKNNVVSEAELRIDCLKQRLLMCEKYAHKVALTKVCWSADFPRHHSHYIAPSISNLEKSNGELRTMSECSKDEDVPIFLYTHAHKLPTAMVSTSDHGFKKLDTKSTSGFEFCKVLPISDGPSKLSKPQCSFHFQGTTHKHGRKERARKSMQGNDFLSLLWWSKRTI